VAKGIFQRRTLPGLLLLLALGFPLTHSKGTVPGPEVPNLRRFLVGELLVAQPHLKDPNFRRTVVFMVKHNKDGALGLVVNRPLGSVEFAALLEEMGADPAGIEGKVRLHYGGPVLPHNGLVLHSVDPETKPMIPVNDRYAVTISVELIQAMGRGKGPKRTLLALGYAGWGKGQLERELERGGWVVAPPSDAILFDKNYKTKWERAYESRYLDL
jgi:putative transcriptional regulator